MPTLKVINHYVTVAAASFSPSDISGLVAWYDASDSATITRASGSVSQWDDKSGNGNHLTQGTATNQPTTGTRTQNGLNVIDFDGTDNYLQKASLSLAQSFTTFVVLDADTAGNAYLGTGTWCYQGWKFDGSWRLTTDGVKVLDGSSTGSASPSLIAAYWNGASSELRRNGASIGTGDAGTDGLTGQFNIGRREGGPAYYDGVIAEVLIYNSTIAGADLTNVESYLNSKWAVY